MALPTTGQAAGKLTNSKLHLSSQLGAGGGVGVPAPTVCCGKGSMVGWAQAGQPTSKIHWSQILAGEGVGIPGPVFNRNSASTEYDRQATPSA